MGRVFDMEGPLVSGLTKIADICILNLLFILCSLPVITIGASATALYYVTLKMVKNEECYIARSFFKSFKQNFKQATVIWIIALIFGYILITDFSVINGRYSEFLNIPDGVSKVMLVLLMMVGMIYTMTLVFVFPVLSKFDNSIKNTIRNAFLMSVGNFPQAIAIIVLTFVPLIAIFRFPVLLILVFVVFGVTAYCNSHLFVRIYKKYMPDEQITADADFTISVEDKAEEAEKASDMESDNENGR